MNPKAVKSSGCRFQHERGLAKEGERVEEPIERASPTQRSASLSLVRLIAPDVSGHVPYSPYLST